MRLRKALVACSAAVATVSAGVGFATRRWRAPATLQAAEHATADVEEWQSLSDYLHGVTDGTAHAGRTLALCLRSATAAWERRQAALASAGAGGGTRPSSAVLLADFLAELHDAPAEQRPRTIVFQQLSDYLLERATAPLADPAEKQATLRYLAAALRSDDAAQALLRCPGAALKLLQLAADSQSLQQLLGAQLSRAVPPRVVSSDDVAAVMQLLSEAAVQQRRRSSGLGAQQQQVLLSLEVLLRWAGASTLNANRLVDAGAGHLLADLAAQTATGSGVDGLQSAIAQLMGTLARECAKPEQLRMQGWLYHLLCFAADASANGEWRLADASLNSLAACLLRGCELPAQLMQRSCLPLLRQLAARPDLPVRPAIAHAVQALAEGPGVQLPAAEREFWSEELLQWLVELPGGGGSAAAAAKRGSSSSNGSGSSSTAGEAEQAECMARVTRALEALSAPAGSDGLHVAHAWLAELIVHLSHQVRPYTEVPVPQPADAEAAAGTWRWYWPFGSSSISSQEADGATAAAATAGSLPPLPPAGTDLPAMAPGPAPDGPYLPLEAASAAEEAAGSSWWNPTSWWPWGGVAPAGDQQQPSVKAGGKPSDSELALYINAAAIGPVYARSVAAALLEASGRVGSFQEPPVEAEELMSPDVVAVYPQVAAAIDMDMADSAVCSALKVLCALASGGSSRRTWLLDAGILPLLHRLTMERARDVAELPSSAGAYVEDGIPLCIQRQAVRLLAMLASDKAGAAAVQDAGWIPWLQDLAVSSDLKLSSCASRALLHIESATAAQRPGLAKLALPLHAMSAPLLPLEQQGAAAAAAAAAAAGQAAAGDAARPPSPVVAEAAEMLGEARQKMAQVRRRLDRQLDAVRPAVPEQQRLVMQDGVHLFDPLAPHHEVLAREGIAAEASDAPLLDIVFVHGIRGGAFATWRREGVLERGQARESLDRSVCWPASWVAKEIPDARLLSLEYAAPASGWEGESLPFRHTVHQLMEKLAAAGVGQRPVIFVCHSMGGLVVKDLLVSAKAQKDERLRRLNTNAAGAVFYSVPHAGSRLADWGWYLRYIGGAPAKHVQQLKTGPHLEELNAAVRAMCKSGQLPVLSFSEGQPTKLGYIPTHVVPHESAYPGYGDFVVLHDHDHISVCKPSDQADPAYAKLMAFLHARVRVLRKERADAAASSMDHMEAATM